MRLLVKRVCARFIAASVGARRAGRARRRRPTAADAETTNVEVDPIRCWWRTSAGAVRIGETFDLSLTCAVLDTDAVQVVPDESRLASRSSQMAPFEVVGGSTRPTCAPGSGGSSSINTSLRIINPDAIGKDVHASRHRRSTTG